ncbi:putative aminopeptidase [Taenia crassiceps]|uniref:Aminopeptidase n=1 Tax=Taenia crassiceps TaxID=6207 RepID=A0ABR4PYZ2_9CEST
MYLRLCSSVADADCDVVVFVNDVIKPLGSRLVLLEDALTQFEKPLEIREAFPEKARKFDALLVLDASEKTLKVAYAMEEGRRIERDIAGSDPERMSAPRIVEYLRQEFASAPEVVRQVQEIDAHSYPLIAAVNRAASGIERHNGKVVQLMYKGDSVVDTTLFLIGKGITYDTGGMDVKAGGVMAGMHRDKGGAAAIAGFFKTLSLLRPKGLSVHGALALVRNSIGSDGYVADEIITSRAGRHIRVGNTDAEGRLVLTELLYEAKNQAIMDNGPARMQNVANDLQRAGDQVSDVAEISTIRKEDYAAVKGRTEYEDLLQCNNLPSSKTPQGHQYPAAFMIAASGLDEVICISASTAKDSLHHTSFTTINVTDHH